MNNEPIYYLNGRFLKKSQAKISVCDLGILRGYGIFDYIVTYKGGKPFLLRKHVERLFRSAKIIGINLPWSVSKIESLINKTIQKNINGKEKGVRVVITGGESKDGITPANKPSLIILVEDKKTYPTIYYKRGTKVITYEYNREYPLAKSLNYIQAVKAKTIAKRKNAVEAIYVSKEKNKVFEGTQSNLFLIKNTKVITPDDETLPGITRELVIKLCKKFFKVEVRWVKINELYNADEIFLASSTKEIMPVVKVDKKQIGSSKPGDITNKIIHEFQKFVERGNW